MAPLSKVISDAVCMNVERFALAIILSIGVLVMLLTGVAVPEWLVGLLTFAVGYFFGGAVGKSG